MIVEPNEMAELTDGTVVLRRVRTGYRTQQEYDGLEYTLYHLAGAAHFGRLFIVEALHLTDETMEAVTITAKKLDNRRDEADAMLAGIKAGEFPPKIDRGHLSALPALLHLPGCAERPADPLLKVSAPPFRVPLPDPINCKRTEKRHRGRHSRSPGGVLHMTTIDIFYQGEGIREIAHFEADPGAYLRRSSSWRSSRSTVLKKRP